MELHETDEALIQKHNEGDPLALQIVIERYLRPIFSFAYRYTKNEADAEDITQEVFIKSWKAMKRFNTNKKFSTWLYTIARRTIYDHLKRKKIPTFSHFETDDEDLLFEDTLEDDAPLPLELIQSQEQTKAISEALDSLPPNHKTTLTLHYEENLTFEEIAKIFKKPMNTVKSWHRRALASLKKRLPAPK